MPNITEWRERLLSFARLWLDNEDISLVQRELGFIKKENNKRILKKNENKKDTKTFNRL